MLNYTPNDISRFWLKVEKTNNSDECWNWSLSAGNHGYGQFRCQRKTLGAHRVAWELTFGEIPSGLFICHHCDNKLCCNPAHLFPGTQFDNISDAVQKGRNPRGEKQGNHKLTWPQVNSIRQRYQAGTVSQRALAKEFKVSRDTIQKIVHGQNWTKR